MREDDGNCPDCNYPGILNKGKAKGDGPFFGLYARGSKCGYCGFKEKLPPKTGIVRTPIQKQAEYQEALKKAKDNIKK